MIARHFQASDYETIAGWWRDHGGREVAPAMLPKCGVVAEDANGPCAACWIYMDNSVGVAWLAWLVTRPAMGVRAASKSIAFVIEAAEQAAACLGYGVMFTMTDRPALGRFFAREGYEANHSGMTQYFKPIASHGS